MTFISAGVTSFSCGTSISKSSTVISMSFIELELVVLSGGVGGLSIRSADGNSVFSLADSVLANGCFGTIIFECFGGSCDEVLVVCDFAGIGGAFSAAFISLTTFFVASCGVGGSGGGCGCGGGFVSTALESILVDSDWLVAAFDVETKASFVTGLFPNSDFDFGTWIDFFWNGAGGRILELGDSKVAEPFVGSRLAVPPFAVLLAIPNCDFGRNRDG